MDVVDSLAPQLVVEACRTKPQAIEVIFDVRNPRVFQLYVVYCGSGP
jgi:hypothetical protein